MKFFLRIITIMVLVSTITWGQAAGNAILMDGVDDYMLVPHHQSLNPGDGSWTVSLWIKVPDIIQRGPLVGKRLRMEGYNQYTLGIGDTDPHFINPGKRIYANYIDSAGVSERSGYIEDEFVDGNWHHIAFIADKLSDSAFVYIDGMKQNFIIQYNYGDWPDVGRLDSLLIARNSSGSHYFNGEMDELSIWNKALSPVQINTVMSDTLSPAYYASTDSNLVGYWRFDEFEDLGIGTAGADDIRDLSAWGNHGDAEGNPQLVPSGILVGVENELTSNPDQFQLYQNFPNPFNPSTKIGYSIQKGGFVTVKVYDVLGNEVATIVSEEKPAGEYEVDFNGTRLTSGVYFYQLKAGSSIKTKKMILMK